MNINLLQEYVETGREIEFLYKSKSYSITYINIEGNEFISFCQKNKTPKNVRTYNQLLDLTCNNIKVKNMWLALTEDSIWVY